MSAASSFANFNNNLNDYLSLYSLQQQEAESELQRKETSDNEKSNLLFESEMVGNPILERILKSKSFSDFVDLVKYKSEDPNSLLGQKVSHGKRNSSCGSNHSSSKSNPA